MKIRPEQPLDYPDVYAVHRAAFAAELEARIPERVRRSDAYVPALSLVADDGGEIVGHVLVSYFELVTEQGERRRVLQLGPIAVLPDRQGEGIGGALVRAAVQKADELREPLVLLEGSPGYYGRFGFRPAVPLGLIPPDGTPEWAFQAIQLHGYDPALRGRVVYPAAFSEPTSASR